ncbi:MAG: hypothetical protein E7036_00255 [Opitutales bacterium]|nr:hypothetical protein [Opitutales bacterium]
MLNRILFAFLLAVGMLMSGCGKQKKIVFVSGNSVHLWGDHEHVIMCDELVKMVGESMKGKAYAVHLDTQKTSDWSTLDDADAVILISEGENNHPLDSKTNVLRKLNAKGVNIGAFHYALMFNKPEDNKALDDLIGGHYQKGFSYNPFYEAKFEIENNHEVLNGVKSFGYYDEWHFNIAFSDDKNKKFIPLIKTKVPDKIRRRRSAPESVRAEFGKDKLETIAWLVENQNGTRGFGIMGGHVVWTLAHKDYRKLVLNMIAWLAKLDISPNGLDASFADFDSIASKITKDKRGDYEYYIKDWRDFDTKCRAEK